MSDLSLEEMALVESYLDAIRDGEADEFLAGLDDDERERLLRLVMEKLP